jgi:hypothetical protein
MKRALQKPLPWVRPRFPTLAQCLLSIPDHVAAHRLEKRIALSSPFSLQCPIHDRLS